MLCYILCYVTLPYLFDNIFLPIHLSTCISCLIKKENMIIFTHTFAKYKVSHMFNNKGVHDNIYPYICQI